LGKGNFWLQRTFFFGGGTAAYIIMQYAYRKMIAAKMTLVRFCLGGKTQIGEGTCPKHPVAMRALLKFRTQISDPEC